MPPPQPNKKNKRSSNAAKLYIAAQFKDGECQHCGKACQSPNSTVLKKDLLGVDGARTLQRGGDDSDVPLEDEDADNDADEEYSG